MTEKNKVLIQRSTKHFIMKGDQLKIKLYERLKHHNEEKKQCLNELAELLQRAAAKSSIGYTPEAVSMTAATLMLSLGEDTKLLTGSALVAKAWLDRAIFLDQEVRNLSCIAFNLLNDSFYRVSLEEAKRYGAI